jgi:hypothetical protein
LGLIIAAIAIMYNRTEQIIIHYYPLIKDAQAYPRLDDKGNNNNNTIAVYQTKLPTVKSLFLSSLPNLLSLFLLIIIIIISIVFNLFVYNII